MLELLFIIALIAWAVISVLQYLAGLAAAPTLMAAAVLLPFLTFWRARVLVHQPGVDFIGTRRGPLPPERFYWPATRRHLGQRTTTAALLSLATWPVALAYPARWSPSSESLIGWSAGALAIIGLSEACAAIWVYVRASQRFDRLAPLAVGWMRRALYRISDNHEFLGEEPLPKQKRTRELVY